MQDYAISLRSTDLDIEVRLNDVATYRHAAGEQVRDENFINDYMANGENVLTLMLNPVGDADQPPATAWAVAELLRVQRGDTIGDGELLAQIEWPAPDTSAPPRTFPQTTSTTVEVDAPDHRGWRNAPQGTLDGPTRTAILKLLRKLTSALANHDLATTIDLLRIKVRERAEALGAQPVDHIADLIGDYRELMAMPQWGVEPWIDDDAAMEVVGNGRLVSITNRQGRPIIRTTDLGDGVQMVIPTNVAFLQGRWVVLR